MSLTFNMYLKSGFYAGLVTGFHESDRGSYFSLKKKIDSEFLC